MRQPIIISSRLLRYVSSPVRVDIDLTRFTRRQIANVCRMLRSGYITGDSAGAKITEYVRNKAGAPILRNNLWSNFDWEREAHVAKLIRASMLEAELARTTNDSWSQRWLCRISDAIRDSSIRCGMWVIHAENRRRFKDIQLYCPPEVEQVAAYIENGAASITIEIGDPNGKN